MFLKLFQRYAKKFAGVQAYETLLKVIGKIKRYKPAYSVFQRHRIGLDINTGYLAWVQIYHPYGQTPLIKQYGIIDFPKNDSKISEILQKTKLAGLLSKITLGIALPDAKIKTTTITLDSHLSTLQLKKIFRKQVATLFNQPIENLYFQHHTLGFSKNDPYQLNFLLIAVQKKEIEQFLTALGPIQLKPKLIDVASFALKRGENRLKAQPLLFDKKLNSADFFQQADRLMLSLGLAMHPCFNKTFA